MKLSLAFAWVPPFLEMSNGLPGWTPEAFQTDTILYSIYNRATLSPRETFKSHNSASNSGVDIVD